ncbi:GNAT family N-acetyltransferase [Ornithinimicrobium flavum]|uniref:GNAT family N-acetyltransferase n=1 Tax=Ornithinimicrobium flavum TaxID=1288636 RepID=UPI001EE7DFD0|nr:GNAT family protein [Ornithinimicrobium flavum]
MPGRSPPRRASTRLNFAVVDAARPGGARHLALMRQDPDNGVVEVGTVVFSRTLQRTPASTEAQYLLMRHVFRGLGYRRYEWKCDSLNAPSRRAALRLGSPTRAPSGRPWSTAAATGTRPGTPCSTASGRRARSAFERWLRPDNFDAEGMQLAPLGLSR